MSMSNDRTRTGKTAKDKKTGAWGNRFTNRAARESWQKGGPREAFPAGACNGKKNRSRWTGKGNKVICK